MSNETMEKYSTYHIETEGFEKVLVGAVHMIQTVPLGTKCRVVLNYDPALQKVTIDTFIDKSGTDGVQERTMREIAEPNSCETKKMFLYGMSKNLETGAIEIYPMNGDAITIHGEAEAKFFTQRIMEYFQ